MCLRTQIWACLWVAVVGCAPAVRAPAPKAAVSQNQLVPPLGFGPDMLLRQRLHGRFGNKKFELECVLQVVEQTLTIVGVTPFGTRAFVLTQDGGTHTFEKLIDREMPFDPERILEDVHRVFFRGLPASTSEVATGIQGEERVTERRSKQGVLTERTFERLDGQPPGVVRVTFGGPNAPLVPEHVEIDNGWYGYTLDIDNVVQQSLEGGTP